MPFLRYSIRVGGYSTHAKVSSDTAKGSGVIKKIVKERRVGKQIKTVKIGHLMKNENREEDEEENGELVSSEGNTLDEISVTLVF